MIFLLLLIASISQEQTTVDHCDLLEINHYYNDDRLVFTQYIFYEWDERNARHQVMGWRIESAMKGVAVNRDWKNDRYYVAWRENDKIREVWASLFTETWTTFDPELLERDYLPRERRRGLTK